MKRSPSGISGRKPALNRRTLLRKSLRLGLAGSVLGSGAALAGQTPEESTQAFSDAIGSFFQQHYRKMSREEMEQAIERIERRARRKFGVDISVANDQPLPGVVFGYALNISKCKGVRACVEACVAENNQSRDTQIQYIRVLEMDYGHLNLNHSEHYYDAEAVPRPGKFYLPIQCMQCENPPCVKACPVEATWREPDGITVIDYDWCIGCRYCMASCPYGARRFNWTKPVLAPEEINPEMGYLSNRIRPRGVAEKCHFCLHRTRQGKNPACLEVCPSGARVFGSLLDPDGRMNYILREKRVYTLKAELGTLPRFYYFFDE